MNFHYKTNKVTPLNKNCIHLQFCACSCHYHVLIFSTICPKIEKKLRIKMHFHYITKTLTVQGVMKFTVLVKPIFISSFIINLYQWVSLQYAQKQRRFFKEILQFEFTKTSIWSYALAKELDCPRLWRGKILEDFGRGFSCLSSLYVQLK